MMIGYYSEHLTEAQGEGAYDAGGHKNGKFPEAENIGPFPEAAREAWAQIRNEAMENYGLTDSSDQEECGKLGPLTEATPANAKNKGAPNKRRPRRIEGEETGRIGEGSRAREGHEGREKHGGGEGNEDSETEEVRRAMAEAIMDMERNEEETERE